MTLYSERPLKLAPAPIDVIEAAGRVYVTSGGTSIEIPVDVIPGIAAALYVSMERVQDAAAEVWT